jgi:acetyl esterase/lipase
VLDIFVPEEITREISIVFVHGGGWKSGMRSNMHKILEAFLDQGFICASFDYRLSVTAFDQLTDIRHAYDYLISFLKDNNRPLKVVTYGSSAGAHLNALMSIAAPGDCGEPLEYNGYTLTNKWVRPIASIFQSLPVLFEPWEDIFPPSWECFKGAAGVSWEEKPEVYKRLAPIEYISEGTQPLFFMNASDEHMFPVRYIKDAAAKIHSFGNKCISKTYDNAEHGFFYDVTRRVQKEAFKDMLEFISSL